MSNAQAARRSGRSCPHYAGDAERHAILEAAITAPSPDNAQPWRFQPTSHGFVVLHDRRRGEGLGRGRTRDVAYLLSLGALLEAARLKARSLGFELTYSPALSRSRADALEAWVDVRLSPVEAEEPALLSMLEHRYSHRGSLRAKSVSQEELRALEELGTRSGCVRTTSDARHIAELARLAGHADQVRAENQQAHEDLHRWLRWTADEAELTRDGLDVRTLGLNSVELSALRFFKPWARMERLIALGASKVQGRYGKRMMRSSPGLGWIVAPTLGRDVLIEAGVVMQRVWLLATKMGLALSPLSVLALLPLMASADDPMLSPVHRDLLRPTHAKVRTALGLEGTEQVVFFFRLGRAEAPPAVRALRRSARDLLIEAPLADS